MKTYQLGLALVIAVAPSLAAADVVIQNPPQQQQTPPPAPPPPAQPVAQAPAPVINNNTTNNTTAAPAPAPAPTPVQTTVVTPATMAQPESTSVTATTTETDYINTPVFSSGATVFAIAYGAGVISAASTDTKSNDRLYVPLVGPWLALHDRMHDNNCGSALNANCDSNTTAKVLLVVDGIFQGAGLLAMIDGVLDPGSHPIAGSATVAANKKGVHFAPSPVGDHADPGFAAFGRF